jgi:hypothetical protein
MSRLNASTPRSVPGARAVDEDDEGAEFARKGLSVVLVGARLGVAECSCDEEDDDLEPVRSGTRAITHQLQSLVGNEYLEQRSLTFLCVHPSANDPLI